MVVPPAHRAGHNAGMSWLVYVFGSGLVFFLGCIFVLLAQAGFLLANRGWRASVLSILALVGLIVVGLSATPLSYWLYGFAGLLTIVWLAAERRRGHKLASNPAAVAAVGTTDDSPGGVSRRMLGLRLAVAAIWLGAMLLEAPYHFLPRVQPLQHPVLYVLGDSVTAGIESGEHGVWPERLPPSIEVHNFAEMGATARSALKQADRLPPAGGLVLIEIGGNDILGSTTPGEFSRDLETLLQHVVADDRTVLMFELPLPPSMNEYGRAQRRLARQYAVKLIPKRVLMSVFAGDGATLDSIHLSAAGHQKLADDVYLMIEPAYRGTTGFESEPEIP